MPYRGANHSEVKFVGTGSAVFDGTGDYVLCGDNTDMDITDDLTMMCWVKPSTAGQNAHIMGRDDGSSNRNYVLYVNGNNYVFDYFVSDANKRSISDTADTANVWVHTAVTRNRATGVSKIYINGVEEDTDDHSTGAIDNDDVQFSIGARDDGTSPFNGLIKNVAVWNRVLTPTEIQNVMYKTYDELSGRLTSGLLRWYSLEDGTGSTAVDSKGTQNGTVSGSQGWKTTIYGGDTPVIPRAIDNAPTVQADGIGIGSASFDGADDYIAIAADSSTNITGAFSTTAWIYPEATGDHTIIGRTRGSSPQELFKVELTNSDNYIKVHIDGTASIGNDAVTLNVWSHVAVTYDGSGNVKTYLNGVLVDAHTPSETSITSDATVGIQIGRMENGATNYFDGNMAQVGVWSKVLTQAQVQSVMEKTYDEFNSDDKTSLVSYWGLDETLDGGGVVEDKVNSSLGSELWDTAASVFTSGTYNWVKYTNNTISNDSNSLKMTHVDDGQLAYVYLKDASDLSSNLTVGQSYKLTFDIKVSANSVTARVSNTTYQDSSITGINDTSFTSKTIYFTAGHATTDFLVIEAASGGMSAWIDNLSLKPVSGNYGGLV